MKILSVIVTFLACCTLAVVGGFSAVMWFAGISDGAGLVAICCVALLIVLAIGTLVAEGRRPGADPWAGTELDRGPVTEDPAEWTAPITRGGTRVGRRMWAKFREQGRLTRTASVARHRRTEAGVQVAPPEPSAPPEPVRLPLPPPVTIPDVLPPAASTEPVLPALPEGEPVAADVQDGEPAPLFPDDTGWLAYKDLADLLEVGP